MTLGLVCGLNSAMPSLYTADCLARLPESARTGPVAQLCRKVPGTQSAAAATLIEIWVERYNPPKNIVSNLTDADENNFWAGVSELQVAAVLDRLGYKVNMRPRFDRTGAPPLTPDIHAIKDDLVMIVEVVTKANDRSTEDLRTLLDGIASEFEALLDLPGVGFLSLGVLPTATTRLDAHPGPDTVNRMAAGLNDWLRTDPYNTTYRLIDGPLPVQGNRLPASKPAGRGDDAAGWSAGASGDPNRGCSWGLKPPVSSSDLAM